MKTFEKETFNKVKLLGKASEKAQSAMEYLMTYGWAILIIAVVLGALFELGVFNANNFAPKAPPGACQVFRPNGPYTTSFINLEGICTGEIPQYAAQFNGAFGGGYNYVITPSDTVPYGISSQSLSIWFELFSTSGNNYNQSFVTLDYCGYYVPFGVYEGKLFGSFWGAPTMIGPTLSTNTWYFVALTYNQQAQTEKLYLDGNLVGEDTGVSASEIWSACSGYVQLGVGYTGGHCITPSYCSINTANLDGYAANLQFYNTSLSANDIQALYQEGIGGAPINLQHLVAWWPLNGNANDYSGNGNNGQINNVNFVSNWYSGYTPP